MQTSTETSTDLVPVLAVNTALVDANGVPQETLAEELTALRALAARLPARYAGDVIMLKRPFPQEFAGIVQALSPEQQTKVMELIRKTRPKKQGVHTANDAYKPTDLRLFQGTGNDQLRPKNCLPGQFYTTDSRTFETPFDGAVLMVYEGRILWPEKEAATKVPQCVSYDQQKGSRYGDCRTCPKATAKYNEGGCTRETVVYLVDREMTGIYCVRFSKSSAAAGSALTKILKQSDEIYSRWFRFETVERTDDKQTKRWYQIKANPVVDGKKPENEKVDPKLYPLFNAFSRLLEREVLFPGLADTYTRAETSTDGESAAGETVNEEELAGKTGASSDAPDFSA